MAKDSAQSRIPRLDGVTRIPVPGSIRIAQKSHLLGPTKVLRPSSISGIRQPLSSMPSLPKSLSGEKITEAANLVSKKTANAVKKYLCKPDKVLSSNIDNSNKMLVDETIVLDKEMKDDANQKLADQESIDTTRTLTRSETFVRDSNTDEEKRILLGVTSNQDTFSSTPPANSTPKMSNSSLFLTRTIEPKSAIFGNTVTLETNQNSISNSNLNSKTICEQRNDKTNIATDHHNLSDKNASFQSHDKTIVFKDSSADVDKVNDDDSESIRKLIDLTSNFDDTLVVAPDKANMKLVLNSTMNYERLLDISTTILPTRQLMNITRDLSQSPQWPENTSKLLYMTQRDDDLETTLLAPHISKAIDNKDTTTTSTSGNVNTGNHHQTDDDEIMDIDDIPKPDDIMFDVPSSNANQVLTSNALQDLKLSKPRFSFGLDLTECTLDCSIELCDVSLASSAPAQVSSPSLKKQNSFEMDESLGILTPDQMKEFLDSATTTTNLDLPINVQSGGKLAIHQMRIDQTPSPEDLPLDPVGVKTDITDVIMSAQELQHVAPGQIRAMTYQELSQTDSDSKTDQMTKSNVSKVSNSFITSVTSITSLDTGYQGDGEMSRPASRGAGDHSPSNGPKKSQLGRQPSFNHHNHQNIPIRRQDPMTDSDFFTESDADDIFHRGDRRAQVIDGQLYGPMLQPSNVFITEQPQMEDSCMESSGIFTDVENRCDDDIAESRREADIDMSPDCSTDTVKSNNTEYNSQHQQLHQQQQQPQFALKDHSGRVNSTLSQGQVNQLTDSQTSSTIQSSLSSERISSLNGAGSVTSIAGDCIVPVQKTPISAASATKSANDVISCGLAAPGSAKTVLSSTHTTTTTTATTKNDTYSSAGVGSVGVCGAGSGGAFGMKTAKTLLGGDDKRASTAHNKPATVTVSVKKVSPSRKHHGASTTNNNGARNGNTANNTNVNASSSAQKSVTTGKSLTAGVAGTSSTTTSSKSATRKLPGIGGCPAATNPSSLKSPSTEKADRECEKYCANGGSDNGNGDMVVMKYGPSKRDDNQENKRPGVVSVGSGGGGGSPIARKATANKWDAVMSKIAENKVLHKKKYSEVKSKVATGVLRRSPPILSKSPTGQDSNCGSVNSGNASGLSTPQAKRIMQSATKRGRSFSKDSQQSSQSDLSLSGGSPKLHIKTPGSTRSAKKRDVRTLSISPTDLGPPPKTQTNGTSRTKQPVILQKRISPNVQQTLSSPLAGTKGSPPAKKVVQRRPQIQQTHTKAPLKDHNRLVGHTQQPHQNGSPKSGLHSGIKATTPSSTVNNCGEIKSTNRISLAHTPQSPNCTNNSLNPTSVIHQHSHKKHQPLTEQQQQHDHQLQLQKSAQGVLDFHLAHANKGIEALGVLLQYLVYDLDALTCPNLKKEYAQATKNLYETRLLLEEARTACHELQDQLQDKEAYYTARESELQALHRCELQKVETSLSELEVSAKERVSTLEAELTAKEAAHEKAFRAYVSENEIKFLAHDREIQSAKDKEQELLKRISALSTTEIELREKVVASENEFAERLRAASLRERELTEKVNALNKQLDVLRQQTDHRERELEEKLNLSHDEISILRHSRSSMDRTLSPKNGSGATNAATTNGTCSGPNKVQMLQDEVESLRCVLELKQSEISDLRKQNQEFQRAADEVPMMQGKISALESRIEDLQIQLKARSEEEKELVQKNKHLQDSYSHEVKNRSRLALHNEELQWRLKQNSEKFAIALTELSKSYQDQTNTCMSTSKTNLHSQDNADHSSHNSSLLSLNRTNGSDRSMIGCFQMDDISPPASPIIKGVVEKSDSVSWVLEMDDESPEALASRMVRRAGSFRSSCNEKSPVTKRQYSASIPSPIIGNPLTQSASATSVLRQHSSESVGESPSMMAGKPNSRTRSKSVTIKMSDQKKLVRQNSGGSGTNASSSSNGTNGVSSTTPCPARKIEAASSWKEPVCSSSPYHRRFSSRSSPKSTISSSPGAGPGTSFVRDRANSFCTNDDGGAFRKQQRNLITCDTSALTSAERLEMRAVPSHPSVQELKNLKKCQEIQESAGEAMLSGTNSEDEGCSASSDETVSSSSASTSSLGGKDHGHMSIEHALLMDKINTSLGGTPMEVSWSEDADQYPSESIV